MGYETVPVERDGEIQILLALEEQGRCRAMAGELAAYSLPVVPVERWRGGSERPFLLLTDHASLASLPFSLHHPSLTVVLCDPDTPAIDGADYLLPPQTPNPVLASLLASLVAREQSGERERGEFPLLSGTGPCLCHSSAVSDFPSHRRFARDLFEWLGVSADQRLGTWLDLVHPDDRSQLIERSRKLLGRGWGTLNYRLRLADGDFRRIHERLAVVRDTGGRPWQVIGCSCLLIQGVPPVPDPAGLLQSVPIAFLISDDTGTILMANHALAELFGYPDPGALEGRPVEILIPASLRNRHRYQMARWFGQPRLRPPGSGLSLAGVRADGTTIPLDISLTPVTSLCNAPLVIVSVHRPFPGPSQRLKALRDTQQLLHEIVHALEQVPRRRSLLESFCRLLVERGKYRLVWVGLLDGEDHWLIPAAAAGATEYLAEIRVSAREEEPEGRGPVGRALCKGEGVLCEDLEQESDFEPWREAAHRHGLRSVLALPLRSRGRTIGAISIYAQEPCAFCDEEQQLLQQLSLDLSHQLERAEDRERRHRENFQIRLLAYRDDITGLINRTGFLRMAQRFLCRHENVAVAVLDLVRLRDINLTLGHIQGNRLLTEVVRRLQERRDHLFLAHLGGGIFAMLLPAVHSEAEASSRLEQVLERLKRPIALGQSRIAVRCHAGLALARRDGSEAEILLRRAELAKEAGKPFPTIGCFRPDMEPDPEEQSLLARLVDAIEARQFRLYFQPKLELNGDRCREVEALARWQDPCDGIQPPARFIPLLEKSGLMPRLTPLFLEMAASARARWLARGLELDVAINISALDLANPELPAMVASACGCDGKRVEGMILELTETAALQDHPAVSENLQALRRMGVKLSIDDFGTGHASLSRLVDLPVHQIKIDQRFVTPMLGSQTAMTIVEMAILLGHKLGLEVVAEGIEDAATLTALRSMGCDLAQGYGVSPPLPEEELLAWLSARSGAPR